MPFLSDIKKESVEMQAKTIKPIKEECLENRR
jgi:hypothetical protein